MCSCQDFRVNVMPQVIDFKKTSNGSCVKSSGVTGILLPSEYCTYNRGKRSDTIVLYSSLQSVHRSRTSASVFQRRGDRLFSTGYWCRGYRATLSLTRLRTTSKYLLRNTVSTSQVRFGTTITNGFNSNSVAIKSPQIGRLRE